MTEKIKDKQARIQKYNRYWSVYDKESNLVCVAVYKKGAEEVARRIERSYINQ